MTEPSHIVPDDRLREVFRYWSGKKRGRGLPSRTDLDPMEIPHLLQNIGLVDVIGDPPRFRFRLIGTAITHAMGRELTNRFLDELPLEREYVDHLLSLYRTVVEERRPVYSEGAFVGMPYKASWRAHRLLLPLSADDSRIDMILFAQVFLEAPTGEADGEDGGLGNRVIMVLD